MRRIGLLGLTFDSPNKGCMALAYSFLNILQDIMQNEEFQIVAFTSDPYDVNKIKEIFENFELCIFSYKNIISITKLYIEINKCEFVFDFTEGDSFSDIYGLKRMLKVSFVKLLCNSSNAHLILGPQTFGPYKSKIAKWLANRIINRCYYCCSRDTKSADLVFNVTKIKIDTYTDIAIGLQQQPYSYQKQLSMALGFNVSALLWNGGYNKNNQFNLSVDYHKYCYNIVEYFLSTQKYEIHLIPHVYSADISMLENDYTICRELQTRYPDCKLAPMLTTPMEIKGYISNMDILIGARMHATIAAFSSGVITIPFAYSKKFEGLYSALNYPYIIDGRKLSTDAAVIKTIKYVNSSKILKEAQKTSLDNAYSELYDFKQRLSHILCP